MGHFQIPVAVSNGKCQRMALQSSWAQRVLHGVTWVGDSLSVIYTEKPTERGILQIWHIFLKF